MNNKILLTLILIAIITFSYLGFKTNNKTADILPPQNQEQSFDQENNDPGDNIVLNPIISADKKSILSGGKVILSIDDGAIFSFFQDPKQFLCDSSNVNNTPTRKAFCTDKESFKSAASFSSVSPSQSGNKIVFEVKTSELSPDSALGIYYPKNNIYKVHFITGYYLGNEFISFSPTEKNLVYKSNCFEAVCNFTVKDAATLETKFSFNGPLDAQPSRIFVRWVDDNKIEYKEGNTLKQASF